MITSYEVGTVFKIVDRASPTLSELTRMMYRLEESTELTKKNMQAMGRMTFGSLNKGMAALVEKAEVMDRRFKKTFETMDTGTASATRQTKVLANEWRDVAQAARMAGVSIANTARRNATIAWQGPWGATPGGSRATRPSQSSRGSVLGMFGLNARNHAKLPGGTSIGVHGHGFAGQAGLAAAGILGYSVYEAAKVDDALFNILFHTGLDYTDDNKERFRKIIKRTASRTGFGMFEISDAIKEEVRMMRGTPGQGLDILPEMLMSAATEAKAKPGTSLKEAMATIIGLAHQGKDYTPEQIKKLAPYFGFLSASTSASLPQLERASGYAAPILQSGMGVDPLETLLFSVALQRAGVTNTKSGTWLRAMMQKALPGTTLQSRVAFEHHQSELGELGLIDKNGNSTILNAQGSASILKFVQILSDRMQQIPQSRRGTVLTQLFGTQGAGGAAVLADPRVVAQVQELQREYPAFQRRYGAFFDDYRQNSAAQQARTAWADLQNVLLDIGQVALPPLIASLKSFDEQLRWLDSHWPKQGSMGGLPKKGTLGDALGKGMGEGVGWGAGIGALFGLAGGPAAPVTVGGDAILGGAIGAVGGGLYEGGRWLFGLGGSDARANNGRVRTITVPGGAAGSVGPATGMFQTPDDGDRLPSHAKPTMYSPAAFRTRFGGPPVGMLHFASFGAGVPVGGSAPTLPMGGTAADDIGAGLKGSAYLAAQRSDLKAAIAKTPGLKRRLAGMMLLEGTPLQTMESLANRTEYMNAERKKRGLAPLSLDQMLRSGFYGPINRGQLPGALARLERNPKLAKKMYGYIDAVMNGSNSVRGFTDQGLPSDPNGAWGMRHDHIYNGRGNLFTDWGGGYGHDAAIRFRREQQRHVTEGAAVHPPAAQHTAETPINLHLDGRVIAKSTLKHAARMGNGPVRAPRMPDYTAATPFSV